MNVGLFILCMGKTLVDTARGCFLSCVLFQKSANPVISILGEARYAEKMACGVMGENS